MPVIDDALRIRPISEESLKSVCAEFMKQKPLEEHGNVLRKWFQNDCIGVYTQSGAVVPVLFEEDGIHCNDTVVSWEAAAGRVQFMLENGTYTGQAILDAAWEAEKDWIAERIVYIQRDITDEAKPTLLPGIRAVVDGKRGRFDDKVEEVKHLFSSPETLSILVKEYDEFVEKMRETPSLMRFHYHYFDEVADRLKEYQSTPNITYHAKAETLLLYKRFISNEEVERAILSYSTGSRYTILQSHLEQQPQDQRISALKEAFSGGYGYQGYRKDCTNKGIVIQKKSAQSESVKREIPWKQIDSIIERLIKENRFITQEEIEQQKEKREQRRLWLERDHVLTEARSQTPEETRDTFPLRISYFLQNLDSYELSYLKTADVSLELPASPDTVRSLLSDGTQIPNLYNFFSLVRGETCDAATRANAAYFLKEIEYQYPTRYHYIAGDTVKLEDGNDYSIIFIKNTAVILRNESSPLIPVELEKEEFERQLATKKENDRFLQIELPKKEPVPSSLQIEIPFSEHPAFYQRIATDDPNHPYRLEDRNRTLSFALANRLLAILDEKQNHDRETDDRFGWYHKTDFVIHAVFDGEEINYEGRYDLGDGEEDLITHIQHAVDYYSDPECPTMKAIRSDQGEQAYQEALNSWKNTKEVLLPFLRQHTELTPEEEQQLQEILSHESEWFPAQEEDLVQTDPKTAFFTPYTEIKETYPDSLVLYQVGDFFEMYGEDAKTAASLLKIHLTSKEVPTLGRVELCGVPAYALEQYTETLQNSHNIVLASIDQDSGKRTVYALKQFHQQEKEAQSSRSFRNLSVAISIKAGL